tara:strand:+ start:63 stop:221 length:159 start_codon:yes stop_codon:yes gene_type:complete
MEKFFKMVVFMGLLGSVACGQSEAEILAENILAGHKKLQEQIVITQIDERLP